MTLTDVHFRKLAALYCRASCNAFPAVCVAGAQSLLGPDSAVAVCCHLPSCQLSPGQGGDLPGEEEGGGGREGAGSGRKSQGRPDGCEVCEGEGGSVRPVAPSWGRR